MAHIRRQTRKERFEQRMGMDDRADLLMSLMDTHGYIRFHKSFVKAVGPMAAVLLAYLIDLYYYFDREFALEDDWFFRLVEDIESDITYSVKTQSRYLEVLVNAGLIETKRKGRPPKRYFRLCKEAIGEVIVRYRMLEKAARKAKLAGSGQFIKRPEVASIKLARKGDYLKPA